ncbi:hypothetical protein MNBD_GAMMA04-2205 [hydrothermal vent metagenome]|uniref:Uncharacterized protein n=1 Tax=hydrothermal vent metagenome TaxID=652676 RepID=A0A3B0VNI1_9ZZZZ
MKKILIYALLLTHICTGLVFASEMHSETLLPHDAAEQKTVVGGEIRHADHTHVVNTSSHAVDLYAEPQGGQHYESHHCHGSAHLVGLIYTQALSQPSYAGRHIRVHAQAPVHVYTPPILRPPIV